MPTAPVAIDLLPREDGFCLDAAVFSPKATVADYIDAMDHFLEERVTPCLGCDSCCHERVPLTLPDLYGYAGRDAGAVAAFVEECCDFQSHGPALDIRLRQREDASCLFLDRKAQRCLHYRQRGIVCHTYICLPSSERALALRSAIVNRGEDALIGWLLSPEMSRRLGNPFPRRQRDYPVLPEWQGNGYGEILLRQVLPGALWKSLIG